jgi:hypothetical protein
LRLTDTASQVGFRRIRNWIESCDRDHHCYSSIPPLPSRVLDVGLTSQYIRLVETLGQYGKYVALSHCWGASNLISTRFDTLQSHRNGISLQDLPRTFQDAVSLCRYLQIRYLWIDSLCIIQDDPVDWETEASRMADIYAGSYFTLAASSATDSSKGCFRPFSDRSRTPHLSAEAWSLGVTLSTNASPLLETNTDTPIPCYIAQRQFAWVDVSSQSRTSRVFIHLDWLPASHKGKPNSCLIGTFGRRHDPAEQDPLNSRGWTLQERLLSTRVLHCCMHQAYWECKQDFIAEDGSVFLKTFLNLDLILSGQLLPLSEHGLQGIHGLSFIEGYPSSSNLWGRKKGGWLAVIESYSRRSLTHGDDKLPAISGLAHFLARQTLDLYYAGLWHNHILEDLHWRAYAREERRLQVNGGFRAEYGKELCDIHRPEYRAPSWSWASLDGHIMYVPLDFNHILAEFIHCHIYPAGSDPLGRVAGGYIKLRVCFISYIQPLLQ